MTFTPSRLSALLLVAGLSLVDLGLLEPPMGSGSRAALAQGAMSLRVQSGEGGVEVVIQGVGPQPLLKQRLNGRVWQGSLQTKGTPGILNGRQQLSDSVAGLQRVAISGSGSAYRLEVVPEPGQTLQEPVVSADGRNLILMFPGLRVAPSLQTGLLDLNTPGSVPQASYAPPLRPRAVAPPLGDMAVGTMVLQNRSYVNVSGPPVTLTLNNAPAKDALMALARLGGYGFVFVGDDDAVDQDSDNSGADSANPSGRDVSMAFVNESYSRALNGILLASGLQGKLDGRMLLVGTSVSSKTFGPQVSKVIRLNQVRANAGAEYLGNLGATVNFTNTIKVTTGEPASQGTSEISNTTSQEKSELKATESFGASVGPLRGLVVTTDSRLQTLTLVGDSGLIQVAENYLKQIDLRQRQVALSVKILDINLDNETSISNSFAFRNGYNFIVSDRGELLGAFGSKLPPNSENFNIIAGEAESAKPQYSDEEQQVVEPLAPARVNPGLSFPDSDQAKFTDGFLDFLRAKIQSNSAKTLASPTLLLSESPEELQGGSSASVSDPESALSSGTIGRERANESFVTVGTQEIVDYNVQAGQNGAANTCQPEFQTAGLTFGARVSKIDDNGFVSFTLSPSLSAVTRSQNVEGCGPISVLSVRRLDTGSLRVRDGQTLILTGVISDADSRVVSKWPILGDIPLIGQFFRSTTGDRAKSELVILVTPRIVDDEQGGDYGYGYRPDLPAARRMMN
ncbi:putative type II secretion system protein D precursor [Synechococcus sp. MIT S9509]|uniref:type II secretion system protein GspD n=1 Tax=Synechococcus sp. MIT S9504 TaxID=1801628 RepID=UPI0007BB065E|nr:type II and III secretion system protein [Synechococcus sp. MIT S9509]KZR86098.1 putative type II secretion system protein D precursor [Synechococcus sp. MIT S9504]KZR91647.1 putative type II secretion system protein D precursor [Synechococcus sp. MIT S9509]